MTKVNEMDIAMSMPAEYAGQAAGVMNGGDMASMTIGSPEPVVDEDRPDDCISVYAGTISQVSYGDASSPMACFDIVFSVGCQSHDGTTRTYQVVKRIGIDKKRIAAEAEMHTPVSVVEAKKVEDPKQAPVITEAQRMRILAGLGK